MNPASSDQVIGLYRDLANQQASNFTNLETTLIFVVGAVIGGNWLMNKYLINKWIKLSTKTEIDKQFDKLKELALKTVSEELKREKKTIVNDTRLELDILTGNVARSFAFQCEQRGLYPQALNWWFDSLSGYINANDGKRIAIAVNRIQSILENHNEYKDELRKSYNSEEKIQRYLLLANKIPTTLTTQRGIIMSELNVFFDNLKKDIDEKPE